MKRREFILWMTSVAVDASSAAYGQLSAMPRTVGFLVAGTPASHGAWGGAVVQRPSERGWACGREIRSQYSRAAGEIQQTTKYAIEFGQQKVDIIVTSAFGVDAASSATSTIPIVAAAFGDMVARGLAKSLARPGGNVTGLSVQPVELSSKRLELLRDII